jgi:hypothetical protein
MAHKHAEFFIAIANGESMYDWECSLNYDNNYCYAAGCIGSIAQKPDSWKVRRKSKTHVVNGFTVPAPVKIAPSFGTKYCYTAPAVEAFFLSTFYSEDEFDKAVLNRGLIHLTKEAAIANAKAMCGIDPESKDD